MIIKDKTLKSLQEMNDAKILDFEEEGHTYAISGEKLPSVTQLLKSAGLGSNYGVVDPDVLERAQLRGEAIHYQVECAIKNDDYTELGDEARQILQYLNSLFFDAKKKEWVDLLSEVSFFTSKNKDSKNYAGRCDLLGKVDGEYYLFDIKTMKNWNGTLQNYTRWQLSLYARALREYGIDVKHLNVLKFRTIKTDDAERYELEPLYLQKADDARIDEFLKTGTVNKELVTLSNNELALFRKYQEGKEELKQIEEELDAVNRALYEYMRDNDILKAETEDGTVKVTRVTPRVSVSIDKNRLELEEPAVFAKYKVEKKIDGFVRITVNK